MFTVTFHYQGNTEAETFSDIVEAYRKVGKYMVDYPYLGEILEFHNLQDHIDAVVEWNTLAAVDGRQIVVEEVAG